MAVTDVELNGLKRGRQWNLLWPGRVRDRNHRQEIPRAAAFRLNTTILASRRWGESGGETFVAVMQATDLRDGEDSPVSRWHEWTRVRAILVE